MRRLVKVSRGLWAGAERSSYLLTCVSSGVLYSRVVRLAVEWRGGDPAGPKGGIDFYSVAERYRTMSPCVQAESRTGDEGTP